MEPHPGGHPFWQLPFIPSSLNSSSFNAVVVFAAPADGVLYEQPSCSSDAVEFQEPAQPGGEINFVLGPETPKVRESYCHGCLIGFKKAIDSVVDLHCRIHPFGSLRGIHD